MNGRLQKDTAVSIVTERDGGIVYSQKGCSRCTAMCETEIWKVDALSEDRIIRYPSGTILE